ncbi:hypothetical protein R3P38DRAFT_2956742 [Favolaschia claudopus]|uniref:Taste receptor type 2 n=1 Tax=Favolaschia claudopus TaxID=2862362 RepID=A0AAW0BAV6_9AGAR
MGILNPLDSAWSYVAMNLIAAGLSLLLYGLYLGLFLFSIYTLSRRWGAPGSYILAATSCTMAILGTAQVVISVARVIADYRLLHSVSFGETLLAEDSDPRQILNVAQRAVPTLNNLVTDSLFLYRCYVIWGRQKHILAVPAAFMLSTFAMGIWDTWMANSEAPKIMFGLAALTNITLTSLTAGRILWLWRKLPQINQDSTSSARCKRAVNIILESGALYCLGVVLLLIAVSVKHEMEYLVGVSLSSLLVNILITFTIVYVALKDSFDHSEEVKPAV